MQAKGALALMLILTGLTGYLLFHAMGIWGGVLTAGLFFIGLGLKYFAGARHAAGTSGGRRIRSQHGRQRRAAQASERKARLEALQSRAHLLAGPCRDTYGAQRCCLEIISQTEKEDPLFVAACELYMRTVATRRQRGREALPPVASHPCQAGEKPLPTTAHVIPFPLTDEDH